jgi:hypothetical protein
LADASWLAAALAYEDKPVTYPRLRDQTIRQHWERARRLLATASANGQLRLVGMNQQVLTNLDRIIGALEADDGREVADAD